jgi:hypothetical protein
MRSLYSPEATFAKVKPPSAPVTTERCSSTISMVAPFMVRWQDCSIKRPDTTAACALDDAPAHAEMPHSQ